jgi:LexA-binding, inner membrane-associated putative hydrolase
MFIAHFAVALAAKKATPRTSLGTLLMAAQLPDLLWPVFLLMGLEHATISPGNTVVAPIAFLDYPISHSLLADFGWGLVLAGLYTILRKNLRGAVWLGILVVSHWVLDAISHRPDMPLAPGGGIYIGLGLWNWRFGTVLAEFALLFLGVLLYAAITRPRDRIGSVALWSFVAVIAVLYTGNLLGPPPPNITAVALAGLGMWFLVAWGAWIDRHRICLLLSPPFEVR